MKLILIIVEETDETIVTSIFWVNLLKLSFYKNIAVFTGCSVFIDEFTSVH